MVYVFPVFMNCRGKFLRYSLLFLNNDIESRKTEASLQFSLNSHFCTVVKFRCLGNQVKDQVNCKLVRPMQTDRTSG